MKIVQATGKSAIYRDQISTNGLFYWDLILPWTHLKTLALYCKLSDPLCIADNPFAFIQSMPNTSHSGGSFLSLLPSPEDNWVLFTTPLLPSTLSMHTIPQTPESCSVSLIPIDLWIQCGDGWGRWRGRTVCQKLHEFQCKLIVECCCNKKNYEKAVFLLTVVTQNDTSLDSQTVNQ